MEWQPIETAPKSVYGYSFMLLCCGPQEDPTVGFGMRHGNDFYIGATQYRLGKDRKYGIAEFKVNPTHWMPLPDAPK